ncbi:MAG: hypothetical protein K8E66_09700 [Phycisphaerales bacterium]|nr:hypothetical protein [Phycisphaerales bacterium]
MPASNTVNLEFCAISTGRSGVPLRDVFREYWPAYQRWMRRARLRDADACVQQFRDHLPELAPIFDRLLADFSGGQEVARFLTLYNPPRVVRACSQLVLDADKGPVLLRSYDHHPKLFDGIILDSRWGQTKTLAVTDCIWGALDGINEHGCAVALAFGGRNVSGPGFSAPLIVRYILETCQTVCDARVALARLPVYMPYTFVVADPSGDFVTAFLGPDRPATFVARRSSANHQNTDEWPAYCRQVRSFERLERLESLFKNPPSVSAARDAFLEEPLWRREYARSAGTLYVAEYLTTERTLTLRWPGHTEHFKIGDRLDRTFTIDLQSDSGC